MTFVPSFDCHAHVYERVYGVGQPRYLPKTPAPREDWCANLQANGLKGGVIVQVSFFGTDNTELLNALRALDTRHFRGVAVVPLDASEEELQILKMEGIAGVRWNLIVGAACPDLTHPATRDFLRRLVRAGLHLQIQLEGPILGPYLPGLFPHIERVVIDHFGLPGSHLPKDDLWIAALRELAPSSDIWVKFSAPYRSPVDIRPHAETILEILGADRVVWGSDWPWTQNENKHDYAETIEWGASWLRDVDPAQIERASALLYGFGPNNVNTHSN
jgi:predicted TIM-barrel fold metal-dependent hydrolase